MAGGYYPEFYLRRKRQALVYRRVVLSIGIVVFVVVGVFAGYGVYKTWLEPRRRGVGATPEMAGELADLKMQEKLGSGAAQVADAGQGEAGADAGEAPKLADVPYAGSFPEIGVSAEGSEPAAAGAPAAAGPEAGTPPGSAAPGSTAAPSQPQPEPSGEAVAGEQQAKPKTDEPAKPAKPKEQPKPKEPEKPRPKGDQGTKPKPSSPAETAPSGNSSSGQHPDAGKPAVYEYRVYAGQFASREAAEGKKKELGAIGMSGSVLKSGGDYLLLVGTLDEYPQASALQKELKQKGFGASFVTRKAK
jgi:hypothetical protein